MFVGNSLPKSSASWMSSDPNISFSKMYQDFSQADPRLAYVAGLIDGEGCIGIQKSSKHALYYVEVTIGMTSKALPVLTEMQKTFGGSLLKKRSKTDKWEEAHNWRIGGEGAASFLTRIVPFLMLKRRQAELAIALETMRAEKGWNDATRIKAAAMKEQMHTLNMKGPDAPNAAEGWYETEPDLFGTLNRLPGPWPRWGMTVGGRLFPLPMLELHTGGNVGGALLNVPTPTSNDAEKRGGLNPVRSWGTAGYAKLWPTPNVPNGGRSCAHVTDWRGNTAYHNGKKVQVGLEHAVKNWPTPTSSLGTKGGRVTSRKSREGGTLIEAVSARAFPTPPSNDWKGSARGGQRRGQLTDPDMGAIPASGKLNPIWVCWLMGWPLTWFTGGKLSQASVELPTPEKTESPTSRRSATAKSPSRRRSPGASSEAHK